MFDKMKGWFGRTEPATGTVAPAVEVAVRPNPKSAQARARHVARILRLMAAVEAARLARDRKRIEALNQEIEDRELSLRAQRVSLPTDEAGYRALLAQYKKEMMS